ncbi:MAG: ankyrin repeat domain-containing protein [Candidatus Promineifilaceae bacterium]
MAGDWKELYISAQRGNFELVRYHVVTGVNINYQHPEFMTTALIACIEHQHYEIAEFLLQNGADPAQKEDWGTHTPLSMAKSTKNQKLIKLVEAYLSQNVG